MSRLNEKFVRENQHELVLKMSQSMHIKRAYMQFKIDIKTFFHRLINGCVDLALGNEITRHVLKLLLSRIHARFLVYYKLLNDNHLKML